MFNTLWLVMAGGALGAGLRWAIGETLLRHAGPALPWGTLAVNLGGSFAAGFVLVWLQSRGAAAEALRAFLIVGVLGGLTTYSALMLECLLFAKDGRGGALAGYLAITLFGGFALVWAGARLAELLRAV